MRPQARHLRPAARATIAGSRTLLATTARGLGAAAVLWVAGNCAVLLAVSPLAAAAGSASETKASQTGADEPRAWLARTDQALATRNYRGVFVHEYAGETETLQVVHRVNGAGVVAERLQSMDGSGREFIRKGNQLFCYLPDQHTVLVERSPDQGLLLGALPSVDAGLAGQYQVRELAHTRVSGRSARLIAITPLDQLRYGYRVWIDEATAMPLKTQLRDAHGRVLEQIVFTELVLPTHIPDSELAPSVDARNYRWVQQDAGTTGTAPGLSVTWQASALPPGFRMTASARQMLPGGPAEHLVFSDGLASVSVFVEHGHNPDGPSQGDDAATLGTSSAYSIAEPGYRITAVGEVPPATVRAIAQAIRGAGGESGAGEGLSGVGLPDMSPAFPRARLPGPFGPGSINELSGFGTLGGVPDSLVGPRVTDVRGFGSAGGGARRR
ncbi:MAG: MucB/RseB C-terminal domain-containing protein [Steroidobacteraceae bacterium]